MSNTRECLLSSGIFSLCSYALDHMLLFSHTNHLLSHPQDLFHFIYFAMFFYRFGPGFDHNIFSSPDLDTRPGDLVFDGHYYFLNLGPQIARIEQGFHSQTIGKVQHFLSLCTTQTLDLIHWMVNEWFSSYNKVIPLFFTKDISLLLKHKSLSKKKSPAQTLIIFPSILSIQYYLQEHSQEQDTLVLSGSSTTVQKTKAYRALSEAKSVCLLATHSQIFQNRKSLQTIHVMDPHSSYYRSFQDPRYNFLLVVAKMRELYDIPPQN